MKRDEIPKSGHLIVVEAGERFLNMRGVACAISAQILWA
jgi:hypothetical protein